MNKITNISDEDLQRILSPANQNPSAVAVPVEKKVEQIVGEIKPKTSEFEPDHVIFNLPSGKNIIKKGHIHLRRLNSDEEFLFTKIKNDNDLDPTINAIFETAIKTNMSIKDIPVSDKLPIFIALISMTYGSKINIKNFIECSTDRIVDVNELNFKIAPEVEYPYKVKHEGYELTFTHPTIRSESIEGQTELLLSIITSIKKPNGEEVHKDNWIEFLNFISFEAKKEIGKKISEVSVSGSSYFYNNPGCDDKDCKCKEKKEVEISSLEVMEMIVKTISEGS